MEENSQQLYSVEALLTRLEKRGLHIRYQEKAIHPLRQIGYYRFRGYCSFFYADENRALVYEKLGQPDKAKADRTKAEARRIAK